MAKRIKVPQKSFETKDDFQFFVENEKEWFYSRIVEAITDSYLAKDKVAHVIKAKIEETLSIVEFTSEYGEWERSLNLAIKWFESQENYEMCTVAFNLIEKIKDFDAED